MTTDPHLEADIAWLEGLRAVPKEGIPGIYDFLARIDRLIARAIQTELLRVAVAEARDTFRRYAEMHSAKGTEEGIAKAHTNLALANKMNAALANVTSASPVGSREES